MPARQSDGSKPRSKNVFPRITHGAIVAVAVTIAVLVIAVTPVRAESKADSRALEDRHQQVQRMSQIEREHLQRNIASFQLLSPADQSRYRQLNQQLEDDHKNGGHLSSLLQTYNAWLQTLTPGQREQLRHAETDAKKLVLIQQFKDEQYRHVEALMIELPEMEPARPRPFGPRPLTASELQNPMKILLVELPLDEQEKLKDLPRLEQYRNILERSLHYAENPREWPSARVQESLLSILPFDRRQAIKKDPKNQRDLLIGLLCFSLLNQSSEEIHWPKDLELRQVENELDEVQQAKLAKLKPEDRRSELIKRYFDQHPDKSFKNLMEVRAGLTRVKERAGINRPRGPGPGGEFPRFPGDRGPDNRGGPDNRNGPDNRGGPDLRGGFDNRKGPDFRPELDRPRPRGKDGKGNE